MKKLFITLSLLIVCTLVQAQDLVTINHTYYTTTFSKSLKYPVKVEWILTADRVNCPVKLNRPPFFTADPMLANTDYTKDYLRSGYDKGHNCPDYDNACQTQNILNESFYYTNIFPQKHSVNAGDWESLEILCRIAAKRNQVIHIWCGGYGVLTTIGPDHVAVPKYLWKVVYNVTKNQYKAYIFNNVDEPQRGPNAHIVDVSAIEKLTGFIFK